MFGTVCKVVLYCLCRIADADDADADPFSILLDTTPDTAAAAAGDGGAVNGEGAWEGFPADIGKHSLPKR